MKTYPMIYGHDDGGTPGRTTLQAINDENAIDQARRFVADGYRNSTWATLELGESAYTAHNVHGQAVGDRV